MLKQRLLLVAICMVALPTFALAETIVEDFNTNPILRGWVDHIPGTDDPNQTNLYNSGAGYIRSNDIIRELEDAFYVPLSQNYTQADNLSAKFRIYMIVPQYPSEEVFRVGFFNKDEWFIFDPNAPDVYDAENTVDATFQKLGVPSDPNNVTPTDKLGSLRASCLPDDSDYLTDRRESDVMNLALPSGQYLHLTYTSGAGANSAGQVVVDWYGNDDTYTALESSVTADLEVGDTFNVNAFGFFTGHLTAYPGTGPTRPAFDNIEIATNEDIPGPVCGDLLHLIPVGDLTGPEGVPDCIVDLMDLAVVSGSWSECTAPECD